MDQTKRIDYFCAIRRNLSITQRCKVRFHGRDLREVLCVFVIWRSSPAWSPAWPHRWPSRQHLRSIAPALVLLGLSYIETDIPLASSSIRTAANFFSLRRSTTSQLSLLFNTTRRATSLYFGQADDFPSLPPSRAPETRQNLQCAARPPRVPG